MENVKVAVLVGSLREGSLNRKLAKALERVAPENLAFSFVEIGDLPFYNSDLEDEAPAAWKDFRSSITACDAVLFVTPEYNRSLPASLKNALDVGSRPMGSSVWNGKPGAVVTGSPGAIGGFGANHHLRQSLVFLNVPAMAQPEAYIGGLGNLFDDSGNVTNENTKTFLETFMKAFAAWIDKHR
ncbi:NADPH-dependent FMN reductase [Rhizobium sp. L1K21]|uniref:NADPH-dependent FMN reductase n=1 Tax=Rhizobium sp. L1K21 TaxID=2954933 RepID=UPI002092E289|nr:NADPH-dependent FMN reductase [Rhizobium sp. L1K21]MCO6185399.1 NAD(P)H-dependent oxidoreductase [Rhizobium sp. L1K21]